MISFRKFMRQDIDMVIKWIRQDHVIEVWDSAQGVGDETIRAKYEKRLNEDEIETFIIRKDNTDIGLIQTYIVENVQDFNVENGEAMGIDLFIGDPSYINKGHGTETMTKFLQNHIFNRDSIRYACIDPEVANERAIRSYEKVGFSSLTTHFDSHSNLLTLYMVLSKEDFKKRPN